MIYHHIYGDLIEKTKKKMEILDVGGGYTSLSRILINQHNYTLVDIMVHNNHSDLRKIEKNTKDFWVNNDWFKFVPKTKYDIVIANDIFQT